MKRVLKGNEPQTLVTFRNAIPDGTWDQMKNDPHFGGPRAYSDCRSQTITDQNGLCAYCEINIRDNAPLKCRIEHFHPKSDTNSRHNWALDWQNLFGVCNGGTRPEVAAVGFHLEPTRENLSCDAHKGQMIQSGRLPAQFEGWIINPLQLPASPSLFRLEMSTGRLLPDARACANGLPGLNNRHARVENLVQNTIDMLNLNCDRLTQSRLRVIHDIEHNKKEQRKRGVTPQQGLANLANLYFRISWPAFFTTIRLCLGQAAEDYLHGAAFQG